MNRYLEQKGKDRDMNYDGHKPRELFSRYKEHMQRMTPGYRGEIGQEYYKDNPGIDPRYKDNDRVDYRDYRRDYNDYSNYNRKPTIGSDYPPMNTDSRDYRRDYNDYGDYGDYRRDRRGYDRRDYGDYGDYRDYGDYEHVRGHYRDYGDYDMASSQGKEEKYRHEIKKLTEELKSKDRFNIKMEDLIQQAKQMGVRFEQFTEEEFYLAYLMIMSTFRNAANDHRMYLSMTKDWLESHITKFKGSDKICAYIYEIVKGGEM